MSVELFITSNAIIIRYHLVLMQMLTTLINRIPLEHSVFRLGLQVNRLLNKICFKNLLVELFQLIPLPEPKKACVVMRTLRAVMVG